MRERGQHRDLRDVPEADDRVADGAVTTGRHQDCLPALDRLREDFRGTLAPFRLASLRPIAIACFRLFTRPPEPLFSVPFFRRCIADFTRFEADFPYLAIGTSPALPANDILMSSASSADVWSCRWSSIVGWGV